MRKKKYNDLKVGEIVVYPKHGVGEIIRIKSFSLRMGAIILRQRQ